MNQHWQLILGLSGLQLNWSRVRRQFGYVRIADQSNWEVVAEYEADEFTDDSNDEKHLFRAEKELDVKKRRATLIATARKKQKPEGNAQQCWSRAKGP